MLRKKTDGYLTIEACVLVSLTFFLFALIIHVMFYLYARTLLVQDTYLVAFRASLQEEEEAMEDFVRAHAAAQFGGKYFGNDTPGIEASAEGKKVQAIATTKTHRSAYDLASVEIWETKATAQCIRYDMPAHMRRVARIADIARLGLSALREGD